jgi:hypothetical protein
MKYYVTTDKDGLQSCHECAEEAKIPRGGTEVPRAPDAYESWDKKLDAFVTDKAAMMDAKRADATKAIVEIADLPKQLNDIRLWLAALGMPCPIKEIAERFEQIDAVRVASNSIEDLA